MRLSAWIWILSSTYSTSVDGSAVVGSTGPLRLEHPTSSDTLAWTRYAGLPARIHVARTPLANRRLRYLQLLANGSRSTPLTVSNTIRARIALQRGLSRALRGNRLLQLIGLIRFQIQAGVLAYSRFTFADYSEIADAFLLKTDSLRGTPPRNRGEPKDERLHAALAQADRLRAKANRLQAENTLLSEQFVTWAINAERKGVTMSTLNALLSKLSREWTEGAK